jgi:hypothetical protein
VSPDLCFLLHILLQGDSPQSYSWFLHPLE